MVISQFRAVVRKLVAVALEGSLFVLPRAEAVVRRRNPYFKLRMANLPRRPLHLCVSRLHENAAVHSRKFTGLLQLTCACTTSRFETLVTIRAKVHKVGAHSAVFRVPTQIECRRSVQPSWHFCQYCCPQDTRYI